MNNRPRILNLKELLHYLDHQKEVVIRVGPDDLRQAEERAHILEGLRIALDNIDAIVDLLKKSKDPEEGKSSSCRSLGSLRPRLRRFLT